MTDQTIVADDSEVVAADVDEATEQETEFTEADADADLDALEQEAGEDLEADGSDADESDETDEESEDESDEEAGEVEPYVFNFNGDKMEVPKDAIPEELATRVDQFVRNAEAETTKKFQAVAEQTKALKERTGVVEKLMGLQGEALETFSYGKQLQADIAQLEAVDFNSLWQSNPDEARRLSDLHQRKRAALDETIQKVNQQESEIAEAQKAEVAQRAEAGKEVLGAAIKNFEAEALPGVLDYAVSTMGLTREEAEDGWALNPQVTLAIHKARMFDEYQAKATAQAKPTKTAAKPTKTMKGKGGGAAPDIAKMSMDQYADYMNRQEARAR